MSVSGKWPPKKIVSRGYYEAITDGRVDPQVSCTAAEDLCRQADAAACDINRIVSSHYQMYGGLQPPPDQLFADVSGPWDYREMMQRSLEAEQYFMTLPATMRERYQNDVGQFLARIESDECLEDAIAIGLREKPVVPEVPNEVPADPPA